jgi:hypothetical protein
MDKDGVSKTLSSRCVCIPLYPLGRRVIISIVMKVHVKVEMRDIAPPSLSRGTMHKMIQFAWHLNAFRKNGSRLATKILTRTAEDGAARVEKAYKYLQDK